MATCPPAQAAATLPSHRVLTPYTEKGGGGQREPPGCPASTCPLLWGVLPAPVSLTSPRPPLTWTLLTWIRQPLLGLHPDPPNLRRRRDQVQTLRGRCWGAAVWPPRQASAQRPPQPPRCQVSGGFSRPCGPSAPGPSSKPPACPGHSRKMVGLTSRWRNSPTPTPRSAAARPGPVLAGGDAVGGHGQHGGS